MGTVCRFTQGSKVFNISGIYQLASGFYPPAVLEVSSIATGTSANRYSGGRKIDSRVLPSDYGFSILIKGNSVTQNDLAIDRLDSFLRSGSDAKPVYFEWAPSADVNAQPYWGQGLRRCEVLKGHCEKSGEAYLVDNIRQKMITADVTLTINPPGGLKQRMGIANGGVIENDMFSPDSVSRGLMIPEATTNKMTNPVFGRVVPTNGWGVGASLIASTNKDKAFIYPGATSSIKLTRIASVDSTFTQSIAAGNTNTHSHSAYVMKEDGTTASASDVKIYYGAAKASTYTAMGNGVTRVSWSGAGIAAATDTGIELQGVGVTVYLMAHQFEEKAYPTPLCFGDLMGCAWATTAHQSTSTRTAAKWRMITATDAVNMAEGTLVLVWMPDKANTDLTADIWLFGDTDGQFEARFDNDDEKFYFTDGTNIISSSATTYAANTPMVLHFTYSSAGLKIYRAGVEIATGATYTATEFGGFFYLGTDELTAAHCNGTFLGFHTYKRALTATEIANEYANVWQHVTGGDGYGQRLEPIPWVYSPVAGVILDAYCDATHRDWIVCGGVPGSFPAETVLYTRNNASDRSLTIVNHQSPIFHSPSDYFTDCSGTANASALGGSVYVVSNVSATPVQGYNVTITPAITRDLSQYPVHIWASLNDAGSALQIAPRVELQANSVGHTGDYRPISTGTALKQFVTYDVGNMENPEIQSKYLYIYSDSLDYELWLKRTSGTANVNIDYLQPMFGDLTYVYNDVIGDSTDFLVDGNKVYILNSTGPIVTKITGVQGEVFELYPDTLNHVIMQTGDLGGTTDITATTIISYIDIIPRWALA